MNKERPVNLNLMTIRFPITAIVSILHRLSGLILFLFIPFVLWILWFSLSSQDNFFTLQAYMMNFWVRFFVWVLMSGLVYHFIAGIRHLLMDIHLGDSLEGGAIGSWIVLVLSVVLIVAMGAYLLFNFNYSIW